MLLFSVHNRYEFSPADLDHDIYFIYDSVWMTTTSGFLPAPNGVYLTRRPSGKGTCCDSSEGDAMGSRGTLSDCITCTCPTNPGPVTHKHVGHGLFNDALNTFYLRLYGVGKQLTEHTLPEVKEGNVLFNAALNTFYLRLYGRKEGHGIFNDAPNTLYLRLYGRKEGNVLFNDALNTFYLRLYGVRKQLTEHTLPERKERKQMLYLTTHSTHFIYGYRASDIW